MKATGVFRQIAERPLEAIEALVAFSLFASGLWLTSPYFQRAIAQARAAGFHVDTVNSTIPIILGVVQIVIGGLLFFALANTSWKFRTITRSIVTYVVFLLYMFYALSQMLLYGLTQISWISPFCLGLIAGVAHLNLKVKQNGRH